MTWQLQPQPDDPVRANAMVYDAADHGIMTVGDPSAPIPGALPIPVASLLVPAVADLWVFRVPGR